MKFLDEIKITVISGDGGNGAVSFRREKFIPFGGPDGGCGGKGGDIVFVGDHNLNTLLHLSGNKVFKADNGENGTGSQCDGRDGKDIELPLPLGTLVKDAETGEILCDLTEEGQRVIFAQGGYGGVGNMYFKSSVNQAPQFAKPGFPGVTRELQLELKLIADIGLVGMPNAGKSTLISVISAARPKIADYPFTTLIPNLGVVQVHDDTLVVADIPGLIEGAGQGKGLGIRFLKHLERTNVLVHLVDISWCLDPYEAYDSYITIRNELESYDPGLITKKEIVCLTKIDALSEEDIAQFVQFFEEQLQKKVLPLSSISGMNVLLLKELMLKARMESLHLQRQQDQHQLSGQQPEQQL